MPTSNRNAANRANAQLSTGPRTQAGKNRSRQNGLRHGLTGRIVVLPSEDQAAFLEFSKEIVDSLHPETTAELQLAQIIADSHWRLNRILAVESGLFAMGGSAELTPAMNSAIAFCANTQAFITLSIYEQRLQRAINVAQEQLQELQTRRRENSSRELTPSFECGQLIPANPSEFHGQWSVNLSRRTPPSSTASGQSTYPGKPLRSFAANGQWSMGPLFE